MILTVTPNPSVDHTLYLDAYRPHETNRATRVERDAGGKGLNASRMISNLGGHTLATGFAGGGTGAFIRHTMVEEGLRHRFIPIREQNRLNVAIEDGSGLPPTTLNEPGPEIATDEVEELVQLVAERLRPHDWLLVAGSLPQGVSPELYVRLGRIAKEHFALFALDADGERLRLGLNGGPAFVKPNASEAEALLGRSLDSEESFAEAALGIRAMIGDSLPDPFPIVVISRGREGAIMAAASGVWAGKSPEVEVCSTVGSGDSMVGAMLFALAQGQSPPEALAWGMAAGAATASTLGSGLGSKEEVVRLLSACDVKEFKDSPALCVR